MTAWKLQIILLRQQKSHQPKLAETILQKSKVAG